MEKIERKTSHQMNTTVDVVKYKWKDLKATKRGKMFINILYNLYK